MTQVAHITPIQAEAFKGIQFAPSSYCNPVQDDLGRWVISLQEMEGLSLQCEIIEWIAPTPPDPDI